MDSVITAYIKNCHNENNHMVELISSLIDDQELNETATVGFLYMLLSKNTCVFYNNEITKLRLRRFNIESSISIIKRKHNELNLGRNGIIWDFVVDNYKDLIKYFLFSTIFIPNDRRNALEAVVNQFCEYMMSENIISIDKIIFISDFCTGIGSQNKKNKLLQHLQNKKLQIVYSNINQVTAIENLDDYLRNILTDTKNKPVAKNQPTNNNPPPPPPQNFPTRNLQPPQTFPASDPLAPEESSVFPQQRNTRKRKNEDDNNETNQKPETIQPKIKQSEMLLDNKRKSDTSLQPPGSELKLKRSPPQIVQLEQDDIEEKNDTPELRFQPIPEEILRSNRSSLPRTIQERLIRSETWGGSIANNSIVLRNKQQNNSIAVGNRQPNDFAFIGNSDVSADERQNNDTLSDSSNQDGYETAPEIEKAPEIVTETLSSENEYETANEEQSSILPIENNTNVLTLSQGDQLDPDYDDFGLLGNDQSQQRGLATIEEEKDNAETSMLIEEQKNDSEVPILIEEEEIQQTNPPNTNVEDPLIIRELTYNNT